MALNLVACDEDDGDSESDSGDSQEFATESDTPEMELVERSLLHAPSLDWGPCPQGFIDECTTVDVPLKWFQPWGDKIQIFASRKLADQQPAKGDLWLLQGGPGGSGDVFADAIQFGPLGVLTDYNIYVLEHRGVGDSTRLGCPDQEADTSPGGSLIIPPEWPGCLQHLEDTLGDDLAAFRITEAAIDLAHMVYRTRDYHRPAFVYGVSYGTLWAQRFHQVAPGLATGIILDSVLPPVDVSVFDFHNQFEVVGEDLAAICGNDPLCSSKLGADPWQRIGDLMDDLDSGHCAGHPFFDGTGFGDFGSFLITSSFLRRHLFPLAYRLERCDPEDLDVVHHYLNFLNSTFGGGPPGPNRGSDVLFLNIAFAEINAGPVPSFMDMESECIDANLCPVGNIFNRLPYDQWPVYQPDYFSNRWPRFRRPILAMNGDLDPQTPWQIASTIEPEFWSPRQNYIQVPGAPHVVGAASPVMTPGQPSCGLQMWLSFMDNPWGTVDTSCLNDLVPPLFPFSPFETQDFFDGPDAYENTGSRRHLGRRSTVDVDAFLRHVRTIPPMEREQLIQDSLSN